MPQRHTILDPELLPTPGARWDQLFTCLLAALLLFMPASFGALEAWSELVALLLTAAVSLCLVARVALDREFHLARTYLYIPLGLFLLLIGVHMTPLPTQVVRSLAPWNVAIRQQLLGDQFNAAANTTLSLYPHATAEQFRLALVAITLFAVVASVFRNSRLITRLLTIIFAIGCAEGALALAQIASGSGHIYWSIPSGRSLITSGTFVNYSNYAQFMNLSLGAGLALLLVRLQEQRRHEFRLGGWVETARRAGEKNGWVFAGIVLIAVAVFASLSRNGAISLVLASVIVGGVLFRRGALGWRGWLIGALPAVVVTVLLVFGFDFVYDRLATLAHLETHRSRWEMNAATLRAWRESPTWGTGLGTHEVVFPMFDTSTTPTLAAHADNDYLQLLEETGLSGALLVGAFLTGMAVVAVKLMLGGRSSLSLAAFGLAFGLIAAAIHSATDYGQHLPANFSLSAVFCGLLVAIARIEKRRYNDHGYHSPVSSPRRPVAVGVAVVLLVVWAVILRDAYAAYIGERWNAVASFIDTRLRDPSFAATDEDYADLLASAEQAALSEPGNVNYSYWLNYYRWESLRPTFDAAANELALRADELPFVRRIADELADTRQLCPTFGPPYALEGQLRAFILDDPRGAELIRHGVQLAPHDPPTCLVAGQLAARAGEFEQAQTLLARAIALYPPYFSEVIRFCVADLKRPELARPLATDNYQRLNELARAIATDPASAQLVEDLRAEAEATLRRRAVQPDVQAAELAALAQIELRRGNLPSAIELYRRALDQDYPQVDWRLNLARALAQSGQSNDALHEVRIVLRLRPRQSEATRLLEELTAIVENAARNTAR